MDSAPQLVTPTELHGVMNGVKLNWLRAAVLGANDGLVSISSILVGIAGASNSIVFILTAGMTAVVAGSLSMAVGEYVSVSSQRDTEKALLEKELFELENNPEAELSELALLYEKKGLSKVTARTVAEELTNHDVFAAHAHIELGIDPDNLTNPWHAAYASSLAFLCGGVIPIIAMVISPESIRIPITFFITILALFLVGALSARAGGANKTTAVVRVVLGGILAMIITFGVGKIFGIISSLI
jgi:VIT1/CCC1 family predicted Fe2+/Mn2+ transporter